MSEARKDAPQGPTLDGIVSNAVDAIQRAALHRLLTAEYRRAGHVVTSAAIDRLIQSTLNSDDTGVDLGLPHPDEIELEIDQADWDRLADAVEEELKREIQPLIERTLRRAAPKTAASYKKAWRASQRELRCEVSGFRRRLAKRWGKGLRSLRVALDLSRELGAGLNAHRLDGGERWGRFRDDVIQRLHIRACRTADEIIILLESGYADGAMGRWRTLHEIAVIASVIAGGDESLAERFLHHQAVDAMRALELFQKTHAELGYEPPAPEDVEATTQRYNAALAQFGPGFEKEYGWAVGYVPDPNPKNSTATHRDPKLSHLVRLAGQTGMGSFYKMASYSVHASPHALFRTIGHLGSPPHSLAGASNAGLEEPGQNTLITLTALTNHLFGPAPDMDDLLAIMTMSRIRDEGISAFVTAGSQLMDEHLDKGEVGP